MLRQFEFNLVYQPSARLEANPCALHRPFEELVLPVEPNVRLHGWFFPSQETQSSEGKVLLVCHGNGGNISHRLGLCKLMLQADASVLLFDYRGYGRSSGHPDEEGTYRDAQAAYHWLRTAKNFSPPQIIAYGESLGGGVVSELALREPLGGLVLQSACTSLPDLSTEMMPWFPMRWFSTLQYNTHDKLPRLTVPVLLLHSRQDLLVGFHHAERNFAAANPPKHLQELSGGHFEMIDVSRKPFLESLVQFLRNPTSTQ